MLPPNTGKSSTDIAQPPSSNRAINLPRTISKCTNHFPSSSATTLPYATFSYTYKSPKCLSPSRQHTPLLLFPTCFETCFPWSNPNSQTPPNSAPRPRSWPKIYSYQHIMIWMQPKPMRLLCRQRPQPLWPQRPQNQIKLACPSSSTLHWQTHFSLCHTTRQHL